MDVSQLITGDIAQNGVETVGLIQRRNECVPGHGWTKLQVQIVLNVGVNSKIIRWCLTI